MSKAYTWKENRHRQRVIRKAAKSKAYKKRHPGRSERRGFNVNPISTMSKAITLKKTPVRADSAPQSVFRRTISSMKNLFSPQKRG